MSDTGSKDGSSDNSLSSSPLHPERIVLTEKLNDENLVAKEPDQREKIRGRGDALSGARAVLVCSPTPGGLVFAPWFARNILLLTPAFQT